MDGCFVVLFAWIVAIRCKECDGGGDSRARASGEPVNGSNDAVVVLGLALEIRVAFAWRGKRVDW